MTMLPPPDHNYSRDRDAIRAERLKQPTTILPGEEQVTIPPADPEWSEPITRLWNALLASPHATFYTSLDFEAARWAFGEADAYLKGKYTSGGRTRGRSAIALQTVWSILKEYLLPPAERVRLRIAIEPPKQPSPRELSIDELIAEIEAEERRLSSGN